MNRQELFQKIWDAQDEAYALVSEYDSLPHRYGSDVLYQAEAYIVNWIGQIPGITITELAENLKKTPSACSQLVKKLINKGLVVQKRNADNKRLYNLHLTADGQRVYQDHVNFNLNCQQITYTMLAEFNDEELATYLRVQMRINEAFLGDVQRSKEHFLFL